MIIVLLYSLKIKRRILYKPLSLAR